MGLPGNGIWFNARRVAALRFFCAMLLAEATDMRFVWDEEKAAMNEINHAEVSFEDAKSAFKDLYAVEIYDEGHSYDEHRYNLIGLSPCGLIFVVFTEPADGVIRTISARLAEPEEKERYERNLLERG